MSKHGQRAQSAYASGVYQGRQIWKQRGDVSPKDFNRIYREYLPPNVKLPSIRFLGARNGYINARAAAQEAKTNRDFDKLHTGGV